MKLCMFFEKYKFYVGKLFEKMKELRKLQKTNKIYPQFYIIFNEKISKHFNKIALCKKNKSIHYFLFIFKKIFH